MFGTRRKNDGRIRLLWLCVYIYCVSAVQHICIYNLSLADVCMYIQIYNIDVFDDFFPCWINVFIYI